MRLQTDYDLLMAEEKEKERIDEVHKKMKEL
jgi:plasmid maintenance system antidote protein VapI